MADQTPKQGWKLLRTIAAPLANDTDYVATLTVPPSAEQGHCPDKRPPGTSGPTSALMATVELLDAAGARVAPGAMTFNVQIIRLPRLDAPHYEVPIAGASATGATPYEQIDLTPFVGRDSFALRFDTFAGVPGAVASAKVYWREG